MSQVALSNLALAGPLRRRLLAGARAAAVPFELYLTRFAHAAFMRRLRLCSQANNLALKGAGLLAALAPGTARYTDNLDLQQNNQRLAVDIQALRVALQEIAQVVYPAANPAAADGLSFWADRLALRPQNTAYGYPYVEASLPFSLGHSPHLLHLRIGANPAALLPRPPLPDFTALEGLYPPVASLPALRATGAEQLVAEKLHILHRAEAPGAAPLRRLQDLWDLQWVAANLPLGGGALLTALRLTFEHRQTQLPHRWPNCLDADEPVPELQARWAHFMRTALPAVPPRDLVDPHLLTLLTPIYTAVSKNQGFAQHWDPQTGWGNKS